MRSHGKKFDEIWKHGAYCIGRYYLSGPVTDVFGHIHWGSDNGLVWYSNGQKKFDNWMVCYSNGDLNSW